MATSMTSKFFFIIGGIACLLAFALIINRCMNFKRLKVYKDFFGDDSKATTIFFTTNVGVFQGNIENRTGKKIAVFLGIPFAESTVGEARFQKAKPKSPFHTVYAATAPKPACLQWKSNKPYARLPESDLLPDFNSVNESENCLYLNIYTPIATKETPKTVMVWIHGGSFLRGFINYDLYDGTMLSTLGDVVVVFISYRVGIMGFLSGSPEVPGNIGLHDQVLALNWIKNNIDAFGGDPNQVVLFGEGSGAVSIGYHLVSPLSKHLFKRAIMQSGGPMSLYSLLGYESGPYKLAKVAKRTNCEIGMAKTKSLIPTFTNETINCIRHASIETLMKIQEEIIDLRVDSGFFPVIDGEFLPKHPFDLVNSGQFGNQTEVLIGSNSNDGAVFLLLLLPTILRKDKKPENLSVKQITNDLRHFGPKKLKKYFNHVTETILKTMNTSTSDSILNEMQRIALDMFFTCPDLMFINSFTKSGKYVYYYQFSHKSKRSPWPTWLQGALHFDDVQYLFGRPLTKPHEYSPQEIKLSSEMIHNWVSFAKTGRTFEPWKPCNSTSKSMAIIKERNTNYLNKLPKSDCNKLYEELYTLTRSVLKHYDD